MSKHVSSLWKLDLERLISAGGFWLACERLDEKENFRMHQIRMRTFGYEGRAMDSHSNSEIRTKWRWAFSVILNRAFLTCVYLTRVQCKLLSSVVYIFI